jgi:hypothetical protein
MPAPLCLDQMPHQKVCIYKERRGNWYEQVIIAFCIIDLNNKERPFETHAFFTCLKDMFGNWAFWHPGLTRGSHE